MKKQKIQIIVLIALLIILCGSYFGLKSFNKKMAAEESEPAYTALNIPDETNITGLKVKNENGELELEKQEDGTYILTTDLSVNVDESIVDSKLESLKTITSEKIVENAENLSDFGLEDASVTATLTLDDGTSHTIKIGDYNSVSSTYYLTVDDGTTVYTVSTLVHTNLNFDAESIAVTEESDEETLDQSDEQTTDTKDETEEQTDEQTDEQTEEQTVESEEQENND